MKIITIAFVTLIPLSAAAADAPGAHFIENWDLDGNGTVTLAEAKEKRGDVFSTFDSDENGFLNAEEYTYFDDARAVDMEGQADHANGKMGRAQKGMTLAFNDVDGDGQVSKAEFLDKAADWLAMLDRNGSGDVTTDDFGPRS